MNPTTPSRNVARRSGRASKPTQHFSSPGYVVERPWHRSAAPVDARTRSTGYLTPRTRARNHSSATSILLRWPNEVDYLRNKTQQSNDGAGEEQGGVCLDYVGSASCTATKEERQREKEGGKQTSGKEIFKLTLHNNQTAAQTEEA